MHDQHRRFTTGNISCPSRAALPRSASDASGAEGSEVFSTGKLSPVSIVSFTIRCCAETTTPSARNQVSCCQMNDVAGGQIAQSESGGLPIPQPFA